MEIPTWRKAVSRGTIVIGVLGLVSLAALAADSLGRRQRLLTAAQVSTRRAAAEGAREIDSRLRALMPHVEEIAAGLSDGSLKESRLRARLRAVLEAAPDSFEVGVAYAPQAWSPEVRLYAPHVGRLNGVVTEFQLEQRYDYTEHEWYQRPLAEQRALWSEPYFGHATQTLVVGYSVPFYRPGDVDAPPIGVVRINLSLEGIRRMVASLGFGQTGYAFLLSGRGTFLASPIEEEVARQRTFADVARERGIPGYEEFGAQALKGERVQREVSNASTGRQMWMVSEPIAASGWALGAVFFQDEISPDPVQERRGLVQG